MVQRIQRRMPAKRLKEPDCPERSGAYEGESSLARRTRRCTQRKPFPKKAAAFFAKGIDERHIDSSMNIGICSASGGYCGIWESIRMLITTTESTDGQKKMPENRTSCVKFKPYTMKPMALPGTAGCRLIWHAKASSFLL